MCWSGAERYSETMTRLNEFAGVIIVVLLLVAVGVCQQSVRESRAAQATVAAAPPTATPLPIGPLVLSLNPEVSITSWEYIGPTNAERNLHKIPFSSPYQQGPEIVQFGEELGDAIARTREDGLDLMWFSYPCSTQPVVIIEAMTVGVWINDHIAYICTSDAVNHFIAIAWETTIPQAAWHYELHDGMEIPPVTLQTQP